MLEMLKSADFWLAACSLGIIAATVIYGRHALSGSNKKAPSSDKKKR